MNLAPSVYALHWLIRDTFRQSLASGIFWIMIAISALCILVCLSAGVEGSKTLHRPDDPASFLPRKDPAAADPDKAALHGVDVVSGEMTLGFGAFHVPLGRDAAESVRYLQLLLAGVVADAAGILLALMWTAGFLPAFLEPSAAAVLLAKPVPRWLLLLGKYLGVLAFVLFQAVLFVGGTWLALGVGTGIWNGVYLLSIPLLLLHFAIFYSFSTFLAVVTRSTVACVFGAIVFWFLCWGMNYGRHTLINVSDAAGISPLTHRLAEIAYWILPKPADLGMLLFDALKADTYFSRLAEFKTVQASGAFSPEWSILSSLLFTVVMFGIAAYQFEHTDY